MAADLERFLRQGLSRIKAFVGALSPLMFHLLLSVDSVGWSESAKALSFSSGNRLLHAGPSRGRSYARASLFPASRRDSTGPICDEWNEVLRPLLFGVEDVAHP